MLLLAHGVITAQAASPCDPATNEKEVAEMRKAIGQYDTFVSALRKSGLPVPKKLADAMSILDEFSTAAKVGVEIGHAAGQAQYEVQKIVANRASLCDALEDEYAQEDCHYKLVHAWQLRAVDFTLNWNNPGSVIRRSAEKLLGAECDKEDDLGGVSVDVDVKGSPADLSDVRSKVLEMNKD